MIETKIGDRTFKIRDNLTLGELSTIQDDSMEMDPKTGMPSFKGVVLRVKLLACCVEGMTEETAAGLPAGLGLKLYAAVQQANQIPLSG